MSGYGKMVFRDILILLDVTGANNVFLGFFCPIASETGFDCLLYLVDVQGPPRCHLTDVLERVSHSRQTVSVT